MKLLKSTHYIVILGLILSFLGLSNISKAQQTATIGTGTSFNDDYTYPAPYGNWYTCAKHQILIRASELSAAGVQPNSQITALAFEVQSAQGTTLQNFYISMKQTTATSLSAFDNTGLTTVWGPQNFTESAGWNTHTFSSPFIWDGSSNLLIETCFCNGTFNYTLNANMYYSTTSFNSSVYDRTDSDANHCSNAAGPTASTRRPNMQLTYTPPPNSSNDAGIASIEAPAVSCTHSDSEQVTVNVTNYGIDTIDTVDVSYQLNNGTPVTETVIATLTPYDTVNYKPTDTVTYTFSTTEDLSGTGPYTFKAWTSLNNDTINYNDTVSGYSVQPLSGTLTIGGSNPDFNNVNDAVTTLKQAGVCDSVFINIVDTAINEQVTFSSISGASDTTLITFQSASRDSSAVVLFYNGTTTTDNYVVNFDGSSHIRLRDITLSNSGSNYSTVVRYENDASNNYIVSSVLQGDLSTATTSTNKSVIYTYQTAASDNVIRDSKIQGGSYGAYLYGTFSTKIAGFIIDGNQFIDQYYRGGHFYYNNRIKLLNNTFESSSTYGSMYRYYFYATEPQLTVRNNTLKGRQTGYGFYFGYCDLTSPGYVANNTIHIGDTGTTTTSYGIYSVSSQNLRIAHNSFNIESDGSSSRAIYITSTSPDIHVMNNNIYNSGPGYGVYYNYNIPVSDHNNIYVPNGDVGYSGGAHTTLNDWQSATMYDSNSVSVDPMYVSGDDLHTCQYALNGAGQYLNNVKKDIDGESRDNPGPDIGADEFLTPASFTLGPDVDKCPNESATLGLPDVNADFMWSNGDTTNTTNVASPGTYSVMAITTCDTLLDTVQVNDLEEPTADFKTDQSSYTLQIMNTSAYADSFFWSFGDGYTTDKENPFLHIYDSAGTYTIMLIANGECGVDTTTQTVTFTPPDTGTGITNARTKGTFDIYPNPSENGQFMIVLPTSFESGDAVINISDVMGQVVYTKQLELNGQNHQQINDADLASGVYYIELSNNEHQSVRKLVIQ